MIRDKGVLNLAKRRVLLLLSGRHLGSKTERYVGRIAIFLYLFIEEQAKPQDHAQK